MSDETPERGDDTGPGGGDVMSSLPRTRPQRPSRRRASPGGTAGAKRAPSTSAARRKPAATAKGAAKRPRAAAAGTKPAGVRPSNATRAASRPPPSNRPPSPPSGTDLVGTAVRAAGELAQLGLTLGTRALKDSVKRIPRP